MSPKKEPPIVFHSHQIKGINGVDDMDERYLCNAVLKMNDCLTEVIPQEIEKLKGLLPEIEQAELNSKNVSSMITQLFKKLNDQSLIKKQALKKNRNPCQKLEVYKSFAETNKTSKSFHECIMESKKFLGEFWISADFLLLLSTKVVQSIIQKSKEAEMLPSTSSSSFNAREIQPAAAAIIQYCLDLWSTRKKFPRTMLDSCKEERLLICDKNAEDVMQQQNKLVKENKEKLDSTKLSVTEVAWELYQLASDAKKAERKIVNVSVNEIAELQECIKNGNIVINTAKSAIDAGHQANKEAIMKYSEIQFFEKDMRKSEAIVKSSLYISKLQIFPKLHAEKAYWKKTLSRQLHQLKCTVHSSFLKNIEFRKKMFKKLQEFPGRFSNGRLLLTQEMASLNVKYSEFDKRKHCQRQLTSKCRTQWTEHITFIEATLEKASSIEDVGFVLKEDILEKIRLDLEETKTFSNTFITIPFTLPSRLIPPFHQPETIADAAPKKSKRSTGNVSPRPVSSFSSSVENNENLPLNDSKTSEKSTTIYEDDVYEMIEGMTSSGIKFAIRGEKLGPAAKLISGEKSKAHKRRTKSVESVRPKRKGRIAEEYERDYGRRLRKDKSDRHDFDSRSPSPILLKRRRIDRDNSRVSNEDSSLPCRAIKPSKISINITSKLEPISDEEDASRNNGEKPAMSSSIIAKLEAISDASDEERPFPTFNVPKSVLLSDLKEFVNERDMVIFFENIPKELLDSLKHIFLPEKLQQPINLPPEKENLRKLLESNTARKKYIPDEMISFLDRFTLRNYIQYCKSEQELLLVNYATKDYSDSQVFPAEIVQKIYDNIKKGETAFNELIRSRKAEYKITKAKSQSVAGFSILFSECPNEMNTLYKSEQKELSYVADQSNASAENVKRLQELKSHLQDYCSSVEVMESKHNLTKECMTKWQAVLSERTRVAKKKEDGVAKNREKILSSIEEKRKKLAELKQQSQKLAEEQIKSSVKAHESTVNLAKIKMRYNRLLDNFGKADNTSNRDIISEHLFKHYKELLSCPTCKVNPKNCALTKCYHLFCEECVMKLFKNRNRKCPECNTRVGQNDYHRVYF